MHNNHRALDGFIGGVSVTAVAWMQYVDAYAGLIMMIGGMILLALRIMIAWREWRKS